MNKEIGKELKELTLQEIEFRNAWREALDKLNSLVDPISKHNRKCCEFFNNHLPNAQEIIMVMDNETTLKIIAPKMEVAYVETYLPYGIDFEECQLIDVQ